jgi:5-methylcytosine-specific restriction endonuclease McrA
LNLKAVDVHAHTDDIVSLGDVLGSGSWWPSRERHPVIRTGQRDDIPNHVRNAVWFRDRGKCELCGSDDYRNRGQAWHLDHITPWSAGGSDKSTNLRVLCEPHNLARSNFQDPTERERRGVTWWCLNCYSEPWERYGLPDCPQHGTSKACRVVRGVEWALSQGLEDWHDRPEIEPATTNLSIAYCAHCDAPGLTDVIL